MPVGSDSPARARAGNAVIGHVVLVMAALAICAITALLEDRTGPQAPAPVRPDQPPSADSEDTGTVGARF